MLFQDRDFRAPEFSFLVTVKHHPDFGLLTMATVLRN